MIRHCNWLSRLRDILTWPLKKFLVMKGVKDMNLRLFWSLEVVGGLLLVLGVALGIVGVDKFDDTMPQGDYAVFAIVFMGVFLIMISTVPILYEKNKTKQQRIEEKDERVMAIYQSAKAKRST